MVRNAAAKRVAGVTVTYRRGNDSIDALVVVPLQTRHDDYGPEEANITGRDQDFLILVADLVKSGEPWVPTFDDSIDWTDNAGELRSFEIVARAGDRCYRHTDQTRTEYRVYATETTPNSE
jgi:hypothetical protein